MPPFYGHIPDIAECSSPSLPVTSIPPSIPPPLPPPPSSPTNTIWLSAPSPDAADSIAMSVVPQGFSLISPEAIELVPTSTPATPATHAVSPVMIWVYTVVSAGTALFLVAVVFKVGRAYLRRRRGDLQSDAEKIEQGVDSDADTIAFSDTSTSTTTTTRGGTTMTTTDLPLVTTPIRPPRIANPPEAPKRERVQEPYRHGGGIAPMVICTVPVGVRTGSGVEPCQSMTARVAKVVEVMEESKAVQGFEEQMEEGRVTVSEPEVKPDPDVAEDVPAPLPIQTVQEPVCYDADVVPMVICTVPVGVCTGVEPSQVTTASIVEVGEEMEDVQVTASEPEEKLDIDVAEGILAPLPIQSVREPVRYGGDVVPMVICSVPVGVRTGVEPSQDATTSIVEVVEDTEEGQVTASEPEVKLDPDVSKDEEVDENQEPCVTEVPENVREDAGAVVAVNAAIGADAVEVVAGNEVECEAAVDRKRSQTAPSVSTEIPKVEKTDPRCERAQSVLQAARIHLRTPTSPLGSPASSIESEVDVRSTLPESIQPARRVAGKRVRTRTAASPPNSPRKGKTSSRRIVVGDITNSRGNDDLTMTMTKMDSLANEVDIENPENRKTVDGVGKLKGNGGLEMETEVKEVEEVRGRRRGRGMTVTESAKPTVTRGRSRTVSGTAPLPKSSPRKTARSKEKARALRLETSTSSLNAITEGSDEEGGDTKQSLCQTEDDDTPAAFLGSFDDLAKRLELLQSTGALDFVAVKDASQEEEDRRGKDQSDDTPASFLSDLSSVAQKLSTLSVPSANTLAVGQRSEGPHPQPLAAASSFAAYLGPLQELTKHFKSLSDEPVNVAENAESKSAQQLQPQQPEDDVRPTNTSFMYLDTNPRIGYNPTCDYWEPELHEPEHRSLVPSRSCLRSRSPSRERLGEGEGESQLQGGQGGKKEVYISGYEGITIAKDLFHPPGAVYEAKRKAEAEGPAKDVEDESKPEEASTPEASVDKEEAGTARDDDPLTTHIPSNATVPQVFPFLPDDVPPPRQIPYEALTGKTLPTAGTPPKRSRSARLKVLMQELLAKLHLKEQSESMGKGNIPAVPTVVITTPDIPSSGCLVNEEDKRNTGSLVTEACSASSAGGQDTTPPLESRRPSGLKFTKRLSVPVFGSLARKSAA